MPTRSNSLTQFMTAPSHETSESPKDIERRAMGVGLRISERCLGDMVTEVWSVARKWAEEGWHFRWRVNERVDGVWDWLG